jgi:NAD-dependent deacetylase
VLKPDVVMFGELLPEGAMERATELALGAGLVLVVGSSLEVYPVAGLADLAGRLAIVNRGQTPYHVRAELTIDAPAGETLTEVVRHLP